MGIKSKYVREKTETIKPEFQGEPVEIRYYTSRYSVNEAREFEKSLNAAADADKIELMAKWICDTVQYIDWTDEDGQPVPLTVERLMNEPVAILMFILSAVTDHLNSTQKK